MSVDFLEADRRSQGYRQINPGLVPTAKRLVHGNRKERLSLRDISSRLAEMVTNRAS
jgi:hypothetical protein